MSGSDLTSRSTLNPLAWIAGAFALGILLAEALGASFGLLSVLGVSSICAACVFSRAKLAPVLVLFSFMFLGGFSYKAEQTAVRSDRLKLKFDSGEFSSHQPYEISGTVLGTPESAAGGFFVYLEVDRIMYRGTGSNVSGTVRLFGPVTDEAVAADYERLALTGGTRVDAACLLEREDRFLNPGVLPHKAILDRQSIDATCTLKSPLLIEVSGREGGMSLIAAAYDYRQRLIDQFKQHFSVSTAGVLIASLLGNRYHLNKTTAKAFREGGTFHVLVISGLHITFIGGLLFFAFRRLTRKVWLQFILTVTILWVFSFTVGGEPPVIRAAIIFTVIHFGWVIFRKSTLLNSLGLSALLLLVWKPSNLFDPSFQLTIVCVLAIVASAFPIIERLRAIGEWHPTIESPRPPEASPWLRRFAECLYWSEKRWRAEMERSVWDYKLYKHPLAGRLEGIGIQRGLGYLFETFLVSLIVQLWLLPLLIIYFHRVSVASIFLSVFVGVIMAVESFAALFAVLLAQVADVFAAPFVWLTEGLNWVVLHVADPFVKYGWASFRVPVYSRSSAIVYAIYFIPLTVVTVFLNKWSPFTARVTSRSSDTRAFLIKTSMAALALLVAALVFHPFSAPKPDGRLRVEFLDVGQGDAIFITAPDGQTMLIDGGGRPNYGKLKVQKEGEEAEFFEPDVREVGESVVSEFLWERGHDRIDYLIATHADADHIQGLGNVAENFEVSTVFVARSPDEDQNFKDFEDVVKTRSIPMNFLSAGEVFDLGGARVEVVFPFAGPSQPGVSNNNESMVIKITFGERSFLLTGDIEKEAEASLLRGPVDIAADVVKIAHHGSKTSSTGEFIKASRARIAVISVGRTSPFDHPNQQVVEAWKASGARVLTTGENGTISFSTDGKDLQMQTFTGNNIYR